MSNLTSDKNNTEGNGSQPSAVIEGHEVGAPQDTSVGGGQTFNSHLIAKNTLMLYLRMILMTLIGLYTSRVILNTLGVSDYGVYNAVGGIISMFGIVTSSLTRAVGRYLTYGLGKGDMKDLRRIFSTSLNVQLTIAAATIVIGVTVGWWFLYNKMNIPDGRMSAATWVLFCSVIAAAMSLVSAPYFSVVLAHERMSIYAYLSILEALLKLGIVFALNVSPYDKLKTYSFLTVAVSFLMQFIYYLYCKRNFVECRYQFIYDLPLIKEMTKFAGWSFFGNAAWILNTQGVNILINIFFGVTLNAARGIASQVEGLITTFALNFMNALNPQITKLYASGNLPQMHSLVCRGAKFSFFLMMLFAIPCCLESEKILMLWLGKVPQYTVIFIRLSFLASMFTLLGNTLVTAQYATGDIKRYQIVITIVGAWVFPLTWLAFWLGGNPTWTYIIYSAVYFILIFVRIYLVKDMINMPWTMYVKDVLVKGTEVLLISVIPPLAIYLLMPPGMLRFSLILVVSLSVSLMTIYWVGMNVEERNGVKRLIARFVHRD